MPAVVTPTGGAFDQLGIAGAGGATNDGPGDDIMIGAAAAGKYEPWGDITVGALFHMGTPAIGIVRLPALKRALPPVPNVRGD